MLNFGGVQYSLCSNWLFLAEKNWCNSSTTCTNQTHGLSDVFNPFNLLISPSSEMGYESRLLHKKIKFELQQKTSNWNPNNDIHVYIYIQIYISKISWWITHSSRKHTWYRMVTNSALQAVEIHPKKQEKPSSCTKLSPQPPPKKTTIST